MNTDLSTETSTERTPRIHIGPSGEKALKIFEKEIATYVRELPRLLEEEEEGRFALVKDDAILSVWDTQRDAIQAGRERFGLDPICVMKVEGRKLELYRRLMEQVEERKCPS